MLWCRTYKLNPKENIILTQKAETLGYYGIDSEKNNN